MQIQLRIILNAFDLDQGAFPFLEWVRLNNNKIVIQI